MARLRCPRCGGEMNRHAEKLVHPDAGVGGSSIDIELGGLLLECRACPNCGHTLSRPVRLAGSDERAQDIG